MATHKTEHPHSSSIIACEYNDETKEMHITFAGGSKHKFKDVGMSDFQALTKADSLGKHFHANIRKRFTSEKVD